MNILGAVKLFLSDFGEWKISFVKTPPVLHADFLIIEQLGVNANITIITRFNQKLQKICHCAGYAGVLIGIVNLFRSGFLTALFSLNENMVSPTVFHGFMLLVGAVSAGISTSRLMCGFIEK